jgi:site-specific DNA recombinase
MPVPEEAERVRSIMRRYVASFSANRLIADLEAAGIVTKIQQRTSGPHRGGIAFRRGSLFHLLKNPIYRDKIVHKGQVYDGEHEAIVDADLWERVKLRLAAKAPPRKRPTNDAQQTPLSGLLSDLEGRQIVATYAVKGTRRYCYYETRKDLARPSDPPSTRFQQGALNAHIIEHVTNLLADEHALRRMANLADAGQLKKLFATATDLRVRILNPNEANAALRSLIAIIEVRKDGLELTLKPAGLGIADQPCWNWKIPSIIRKPFREARLRIDAADNGSQSDRHLLKLLAEGFEVQQLVFASPELNLNQLSKREGRCRTQLARLLRISWLSPRIVEAVAAGSQPNTKAWRS